MKKTWFACAAVGSLVLTAAVFASTYTTRSIRRLDALPVQTTRRIYACSGNVTWDGLFLYRWGTETVTTEMTYVCDVDDEYGKLYFADVPITKTNGFLFGDASDLNTQGNPKWSSSSKKSVDVVSLADWGNADVYALAKSGTSPAQVNPSHSLALSAAKVASILKYCTTCASEATYTNGCLAYPQLQADFNIDVFYADETSVPATVDGEKTGTTLGEKVLGIRAEYEKLGGTCEDLPDTPASSSSASSTSSAPSSSESQPFDGIRIYVDKKWTNVFLWGGASSASWPGNPLTNSVDDNWWLLELPGVSSTNIIFNTGNGGEQTADLSRTSKGTYYYYGNYFYDANPLEGLISLNEGMRILHCFDWSLSNIEKRLGDIKAAGFDAIQTSPLQIHKSFGPWAQYESGNWYFLYQPIGFSVAPSNKSYLGGPSELKSLTSAADKYGIKVIVDVVANHLGGTKTSFDSGVKTYEPEIYNDSANTIHQLDAYVDDNSVQKTVQGHLGELLDLNTGNAVVQSSVLKYLKELIDDGVDGFRFDAAKHIETTQDGKYASSFWTNTYLAAKTYASNKGIDLFAYGEILGWAGNGRKTSDYIDYAGFDAVTDDVTGNDLAAAIVANNSLVDDTYNTGLAAKRNVLWAESHDTFMNVDGVSKNYSQIDVDATYALLSARNRANLLYFTRPSGTIGTPASANNWRNDIVTAANRFHGQFDGTSERLASSGKATFVERYGGGKYGMAVVNPTTTAIDCTVSQLPNGNYVDTVSGESYAIANKKVRVPANTTLILVKS